MPNYTVILVPFAEQDLQGIYKWYESKRGNLGLEFIIELDKCIYKISSNPYFPYSVLKDVRRVSLHGFPYNVYYIIEGNVVYILVIMHQYRNPEVWQLRVGEV